MKTKYSSWVVHWRQSALGLPYYYKLLGLLVGVKAIGSIMQKYCVSVGTALLLLIY